jgi:magnesium transporter
MTDRLKELLDRHRLVDGLLRNQAVPSGPLVETLVRRQHDSEIAAALERCPDAELGAAIATLPLDEARLLWSHVPESRRTALAREIEDGRLEALDPQRPHPLDPGRVRVFASGEGRLRTASLSETDALVSTGTVWVDLVGTTRAERARIGAMLGLDLDVAVVETELQVSARFAIDDVGTLRIAANFIDDGPDALRTVPVAFHLRAGRLVSVRDGPLPSFDTFAPSPPAPGAGLDGTQVLLDLLGADVERSADALERTYAALEEVGRLVLGESVTDREAAATLAQIAEQEARIGRIRSNVLDTQRAIGFLLRHRVPSPEQAEDAKRTLHDIDSLNGHTAYLFDKVNFLMDATIGFINVNQNRRVNQLTVFSVVFMPINILAGIGGMSEYSMMTEGIRWPIAYGAFVACAAGIGWLTYVALKRFERPRRRTPRKA